MAQKVITIILGVLVIISGIYCCTNPVITQIAIGAITVIVLAITMIAQGIGEISAWRSLRKANINDGWTLASGIVSIIFGTILTSCFISGFTIAGVTTAFFLAYLLAIWFTVTGFLRIVSAFKLRKISKNLSKFKTDNMRDDLINSELSAEVGKNWIFVLITGIVMVLFGVFCICQPLGLVAFMGIMFGFGLIFGGCSVICLAIAAPSK